MKSTSNPPSIIYLYCAALQDAYAPPTVCVNSRLTPAQDSVHATPTKTCGTVHTLSVKVCYDLTSRLRPVRRRDKSIQILRGQDKEIEESHVPPTRFTRKEDPRGRLYHVPLLFTGAPRHDVDNDHRVNVINEAAHSQLKVNCHSFILQRSIK